jgi:3-oxoacyl-[acyl-carrier protein] reductase
MQSAAVTLGAHGVSCTAVAPGWVDTPMASSALSSPSGAAVLQQSPWRRVATPEEVAAAVEALARYWDTAFCTGTVLDVNGASYLH